MYSNYNVFTKFCAAVLEELHLRKTTGRTNGRTDGLVRISHILLWWFANGVHSVHSTWGIAMNCQSSLVITYTPVMCKFWIYWVNVKTNFTTWQSHVLQWEFPTWVAIDRFLLILTILFHPPFISLKALTCSRSMQHLLLTKNFDFA